MIYFYSYLSTNYLLCFLLAGIILFLYFFGVKYQNFLSIILASILVLFSIPLLVFFIEKVEENSNNNLEKEKNEMLTEMSKDLVLVARYPLLKRPEIKTQLEYHSEAEQDRKEGIRIGITHNKLVEQNYVKIIIVLTLLFVISYFSRHLTTSIKSYLKIKRDYRS